MSSFINLVDSIKEQVMLVCMIVLAVFLLLCLIKAIIGPRVSDRVICVNMMGTIVMVIITILALKIGEGYLVDICLIYAMISFLSVVVLCKVYTGVAQERRMKERIDIREEQSARAVEKKKSNSAVAQFFDKSLEGK